MSEENVEIVRRAFEAAFGRPPDWPTVNALFDREHELTSLIDRLERGGASSKGMTGWDSWRARMDDVGDWRGEVADVRPAPDGRCAVRTRVLIRGERSGVQVEQGYGVVATLRGGRIIRSEIFQSWQEALKAVGLA
jgi:ketosteroid isomerase-like protein